MFQSNHGGLQITPAHCCTELSNQDHFVGTVDGGALICTHQGAVTLQGIISQIAAEQTYVFTRIDK